MKSYIIRVVAKEGCWQTGERRLIDEEIIRCKTPLSDDGICKEPGEAGMIVHWQFDRPSSVGPSRTKRASDCNDKAASPQIIPDGACRLSLSFQQTLRRRSLRLRVSAIKL